MKQDVTQTTTTYCLLYINYFIDAHSSTYCHVYVFFFAIMNYSSTSLPRVLNCITNDNLISYRILTSISSIIYCIFECDALWEISETDKCLNIIFRIMARGLHTRKPGHKLSSISERCNIANGSQWQRLYSKCKTKRTHIWIQEVQQIA